MKQHLDQSNDAGANQEEWPVSAEERKDRQIRPHIAQQEQNTDEDED
jgi:hypothetical protein